MIVVQALRDRSYQRWWVALWCYSKIYNAYIVRIYMYKCSACILPLFPLYALVCCMINRVKQVVQSLILSYQTKWMLVQLSWMQLIWQQQVCVLIVLRRICNWFTLLSYFADLKPLLTPEAVTELVLVSLKSVPSRLPKSFLNSYTPIAAAGTDSQVIDILLLISTCLHVCNYVLQKKSGYGNY